MDELTRQTLQLLDEIARREASGRPPHLSPAYLRDVEVVENLPRNRPGTDKTSLGRAQRDFLATYKTVTRVR